LGNFRSQEGRKFPDGNGQNGEDEDIPKKQPPFGKELLLLQPEKSGRSERGTKENNEQQVFER
jgi:hypothetical protein